MPTAHSALRIPVALLGLFATIVLLGALAHTAHAETTCTSNTKAAGVEPPPFQGICDYLDGRAGVVQVAIWDQRAGRLYRLSDGGDATQYTADSFAQPLRRVFGEVVFLSRERVEIPPPGDTRPARLTVRLRDLVWDVIYAPIGGWVSYASEHLNTLQFLTIRQYLSLVFAALVTLLLVVAIWT